MLHLGRHPVTIFPVPSVAPTFLIPLIHLTLLKDRTLLRETDHLEKRVGGHHS